MHGEGGTKRPTIVFCTDLAALDAEGDVFAV